MSSKQRIALLVLTVSLLLAAEFRGLRKLNFEMLSFNNMLWPDEDVSSTIDQPPMVIEQQQQQQSTRNQQQQQTVSIIPQSQSQIKQLCIMLDTLIPIQNEWIPNGTSSIQIVLSSASSHTNESITLNNNNNSLPSWSYATKCQESIPDYHLLCVEQQHHLTFAKCLQKAFNNNTTATVVASSRHSWWLSSLANNYSSSFVVIPLQQDDEEATNRLDKSTTTRRLQLNHVVLYVSCEQQQQQQNNLGPNLGGIIPNYIDTITILSECPTNDDSSFHDFLVALHPLANVSSIAACDGDECHNAIMTTTADLLVCVDSMKCIIPILLQNSRLPTAATILAGPTLYEWLSTLQPPNIKLIQWNPNNNNNSNTTNCNNMRGRLGKWKFDPTYHDTHKYVDYKWIPTSRDHLNDTQRHNKFVWDDAICPVRLLTKEKFCRVMRTLGYRRLFAIGDSLQYMAMVSFSHLLGLPRIKVHSHTKKKDLLYYTETLKCSKSFDIELSFYRSNHYFPVYGNYNATVNNNNTNSTTSVHTLRETSAASRIARENDLTTVRTPRVYFVCNGLRKSYYPDERGNCRWVDHYIAKSDVPTLFWMGAGPHTHLPRIFQESLNNFEDFLRRYPRPNDLVLLRTLSPGHPNCQPSLDPYPSFGEYMKYGQTTEWDWHLFVQYNKRIEELAWRFNTANSNNWTGATVDIHDIYWMTTLRIDGHPNAADCLHYLLPGPPDWWIHTLYSKLQDMAEAKQKEKDV